MGSLMIEPDEIQVDLLHSPFNTLIAKKLCIPVAKMASRSGGIFYNSNPLSFQAPILIFHLSLCASIILVTAFLLKPTGQPLLLSQLLGGILLGPSFLGFKKEIRNTLFPLQSLVMLDVVSDIGIMFYFFLVGVKMEPILIKKSGKKAYTIGISVVIVPLILSKLACFIVVKWMKPNPTMTHSIPLVGVAETMISFPVIAHYLTELKIANTDCGRLAMSSSMISSLFTVGLLLFISMFKPNQHTALLDQIFYYMEKVAVLALLIGLILLVIQPTLLWMMSRYSTGETVNQALILGVLVAVMMSGFISGHIGQHVIIGPFLLGLTIPAGPPLGSTLVKRLEVIITWILMPLYLVKNGLCLTVIEIGFKEFAIVQVVILSTCLGKFLGAFSPSLYFRMPLKEALSLGSIMNVQGILEITIFRMMHRKKLIDGDSFVVMCISMLVITGVITPLVRVIYGPSRKYIAYQKRTILQLKPHAELRLLACIHDGDHIQAMMNLIEVSNHTKENPICVYVLHLVELIGRFATLLISHDEQRKTPPSNIGNLSRRVVIAFRNYAKKSMGSLTVQSFTSISSYETMADDVCTLALNKRVTLIVIPFYKQWPCNGVLLMPSESPMRSMNFNVLNKAPCSVAILVDRGRLRSYKHCKEFLVAMFFLGGADDREALAYAARMSWNPKVKLTVIRFLPHQEASVNGDNYEKQVKLDNIVVADFRIKMASNKQVVYKEEMVTDGSKTVSFIRSIENDYQLILVGRGHDEQSPHMVGLAGWDNEETLLGPIGDYLASSDFRGNATALVVQQQTNVVEGSSEDSLGDLIPYELG